MDRKEVFKNAVELYGLDFGYTLSKRYNKEFAEITMNIAKRLKKELLPKLKMIDDFKIIFGNIKGNDALGLYINGSYAWKPIFVLDLINLRNACSKYGSFISSAIETTILHEIGHAIQDSLGLEDIMWTDEAEDEAEEFAYQYYTFGKIMPIKERSLYA